MNEELFKPALIERLVGVVEGDPIPVPHGSDARWARDASGRQWACKREENTGFNGLLAEAASYLLGRDLEVRQPNAAVFHDGEQWFWLSERVAGAGEHWHEDMRDFIDNPDELGRMLALDALTANVDRHRRNILVEPMNDEAHLRLWAIDSGNAIIGQPADYIGLGLDVPAVTNHAHGLPIAAVRGAAMAGAQVALALPNIQIRAIVVEACGLAREPKVDALADALIKRCRHAPEIVSSYLDALGARS